MNKTILFAFLFLLTPVLLIAEDPLAKLKAEAEGGNPKAQLEYGLALQEKADLLDMPEGIKSYDDPRAVEFRKGQDQQTKVALDWMRKAADQNYIEAVMTLYYVTYGEEKLKYLEKAAALKHAPAFNYLIETHARDEDQKKGLGLAKKWGEKAKSLELKIDEDARTILGIIDYCINAKSAIIPASLVPSKEIQKQYKAANCAKFRTGEAEATDWTKYKDCVLTPDTDYPEYGEVELFANGWGVKRDPELALALACKSGPLGQWQISHMVEDLSKTKAEATLQKPFIACRFSYDNISMNSCSRMMNEFSENKRKLKLGDFTSKWSSAEKEAFEKLKASADEYFGSHATNERDRSGSMSNRVAGAEVDSLKERFLKSLREFEAGKYPKKYDYKVADKKLNELYQSIMKVERKDDGRGTSITNANIRETQRKWLKYRNAWEKFVKLKYPKASPDLWNAWLTKERYVLLRQSV